MNLVIPGNIGIMLTVAGAPYLAWVFAYVKFLVELIPGARPKDTTHDDALRLAVLLLSEGTTLGVGWLVGRTAPEEIGLTIFAGFVNAGVAIVTYHALRGWVASS